MLKKFSVSILALGTGLVGSLSARAEDVTFVFRTTGHGAEQTATHHYTRTRVRLDQGDVTTIVDFTSGRIFSISPRKKQYSETTFAEIEQALTAMSAEMGKAMAGIPAGLRDKMMGDAAKEVTLIKGEMRTVAGVVCQNYTVTLGEKSRLESCVTTSITPPFDPKNFKNLALVTTPSWGNGAVNKLVQKMREIEGFSLSSSTSLGPVGKRIETATEATEVRKGPIEDQLFDLPPGFKKVNSPFAELSR